MTREDYKNDKIYSDTGYCSARFARVRPQANERKKRFRSCIFHSCPKSVLKKEGEMRGKISTKKKKTKMEIEFWGASY